MSRGAPKGNKYAKKDQKREGESISLYLDAYTMEFLQAACKLDGQEPTIANARKRAKVIAKKAIDQDMRRTFVNPQLVKTMGIDLNDASPE